MKSPFWRFCYWLLVLIGLLRLLNVAFADLDQNKRGDGSLQVTSGTVVFAVPTIQGNWEFVIDGGGFKAQSGSLSVNYQTGPVLYQLYPFKYSSGAQFGPGGNFTATAGTASACSGCQFLGAWKWTTLRVDVLSSGEYVYTFSGELSGTFVDSVGNKHHASASYTQHMQPQSGLLGDASVEGFGAGGLSIVKLD